MEVDFSHLVVVPNANQHLIMSTNTFGAKNSVLSNLILRLRASSREEGPPQRCTRAICPCLSRPDHGLAILLELISIIAVRSCAATFFLGMWLSSSAVCFFLIATVMRIKDSLEQFQYLAEASRQGNLELIFSALDVLGSTPWVVNKDVFRVVLDVWNSGDALAEIPPAHLDIPDPMKPADYDSNDVSKKDYLMNLKDTINKRRNNHSDRCSVNYKLEIARAVCAPIPFPPRHSPLI